MPQNRWQLGVMYYGGLDLLADESQPYPPTNTGTLNGNLFWSQPDGPGGKVFPSEYSGPFLAYPIPGVVMSEYTPWWAPGCGHSIRYWKVIREFDYDSSQSVALICCSTCSWVQNVYMDFEQWLEPITHAIIVA